MKIMESFICFSYIGLSLLFTKEFLKSIYDIGYEWIFLVLGLLIIITYISKLHYLCTIFDRAKNINKLLPTSSTEKKMETDINDATAYSSGHQKSVDELINSSLYVPSTSSYNVSTNHNKSVSSSNLRSHQSFPPALSSIQMESPLYDYKSIDFKDFNFDAKQLASIENSIDCQTSFHTQQSFNTDDSHLINVEFNNPETYSCVNNFEFKEYSNSFNKFNSNIQLIQVDQFDKRKDPSFSILNDVLQNDRFEPSKSNVHMKLFGDNTLKFNTTDFESHQSRLSITNPNAYNGNLKSQFCEGNNACFPQCENPYTVNHPFIHKSNNNHNNNFNKIQTTESQKLLTDSISNEDVDSYFEFLDCQLKSFETHSITLQSFSNIINNKGPRNECIESVNRKIFEIPIEILIKYFNLHNHRILGIQFMLLASIHVDKISPVVAADLLRLLVRLLTYLPLCEEVLCKRVVQAEPYKHYWTANQIALTVWSVAKTSFKHINNAENSGHSRNNLRPKPHVEKLFEFFANETINQIDEFQPLSIANVMWAFAKMNIRNDKLFEILAEHTLKNIASFNAQNIVNVYWSLGTIEMRNTVLTCSVESSASQIRLTEVILSKLPSFNTQAVANFAWACGKLQWGYHLFTSLGIEAQNKLKFFKPQEIANFMWAVAKMKIISLKPIIKLFANHAASNISRFNLQEVSNIYWCLGTLELSDTKLTPIDLVSSMEVISEENTVASTTKTCINDDLKKSFSYSNLNNNSLGAIASFNNFDNTSEMMYDQSSKLCTSTLMSINKTPLSAWNENKYKQKSLSATSTMETFTPNFHEQNHPVSYFNSEESNVLLYHLLQKVENFNAQATANVLWTCGKLQWKCVLLCQALEQAIIKNIHTLRPQNTANCLWALAKLRTNRIHLIHLLVETAYSQLTKFNTQEIANIYWALGTLEISNTALTPSSHSLLGNSSDMIVRENDFSHIDEFCLNNSKNVFRNRNIAASDENLNSNSMNDKFLSCVLLQQQQQPKKTADTTSCVFTDNSEISKQDSFVCKVVCEKLQYFKPQEIANFVWACARLKWKITPILEKSCLVSLQIKNQFKPQEVGNLLWALAKLNYRHTNLIVALCNDASTKLNLYIPQNISNIYWALASLEVTSTNLTSDYPKFVKLKYLLALIKKFNQQEIVNFVWACNKLNWNNPDVMSVAAQVVFSRITNFQMIDILNLQQAFKKLGYKSVAKQLVMINCGSLRYTEVK